MIIREKYLEQIRPYYDARIIKIITGVRRSGKTTLIEQIIDELFANGVKKDHIYVMDYDKFENLQYTNTAIVTKYIQSIVKDNDMYYLFFDEVQNLNEWPKILGFYNIINRLSIFVTGSNSDLYKDKNIDYITQYRTFTLYPLSYSEMCIEKNTNNYLDEYLKWGGMPYLLGINNSSFKYTNTLDVYNSIIVKDIVNRYKVKDIELLNRIINYILNNIPNKFSVTNMSKYFASYDRKVSLDTMYNYLNYIDSSFLLCKLERYSINENRIVSGKYKYYVSDFSFYNIIDKEIDTKYKLENLVYLELISRGYDVKQAIVGLKEIDFIATKNKRKKYIEVYDYLTDDIRDKAFKKYNRITDGVEKYIFSLDTNNYSTKNVKHINIIDFINSKNF